MGKSLRAVNLFNGWPVGDEIVKRRYVRIVSVLFMFKIVRFIFVILIIGEKGWKLCRKECSKPCTMIGGLTAATGYVSRSWSFR